MFFEAELRFGVKVISRLTHPQNRQDKPNTPDYCRAHCLELPIFVLRVNLPPLYFVGLLDDNDNNSFITEHIT